MAGLTRREAALRLVALLALLVLAGAIIRFTPAGDFFSREGIFAFIEGLRGSVWAPLLFVALYTGAMVLALPGTILTLTGGAVFGFWGGFLLNTIGANLGANGAFLLARKLGRRGVQGLAGEGLQNHLARLDAATERHGFRGLLVLRLIPVVPFNGLNFGAGLTAMRWRDYAGATLLGILPGTAVYTFFADALLQGSREASREAFLRVLVAGLLLALLAVMPLILKKLRVTAPGAILLALIAGGFLTPTQAAAQPLPSHTPFTELLSRVVVDDRVDYAALAADRAPLDRYLDSLAAVTPPALQAASREDRLAFWINAYNACMLRLVVDHYPIRRERVGLFQRARIVAAGYPENSVWQIRDVFSRDHCRIAGADRSQDEIEHEIIRPEFQEPRIHFAVNCAALSCPVLWPEAYEGSRLDEQLDRAVFRLMGTPNHFRIEIGTPATLHLNRVLDWYSEDFGGVEGLKRFFGDYLSGRDRELVIASDTRVRFFEYDWTLNDVDR